MDGMDALKNQEVKVEKPEDVAAMERELQDQNPQVQVPNFKPFARIINTFTIEFIKVSFEHTVCICLYGSRNSEQDLPFFILKLKPWLVLPMPSPLCTRMIQDFR